MNRLSSLFFPLFAFVLLGAALPANSLAGENPHRGEKSFWADALGKLDLTAEQRKSLEELRESANTDRKKARQEIGALRRSLHEKLNSTAPEAELRTLFAEIEKRSSESHRAKFERMLKVRSILTPAQREQLLKLGNEKHGVGRHEGKRNRPDAPAETED